jgi:hypothetical protein
LGKLGGLWLVGAIILVPRRLDLTIIRMVCLDAALSKDGQSSLLCEGDGGRIGSVSAW